MGLPLYALKRIAPYLKGARVLSLGYPDLLIDVRQAEELFGIVPRLVTDRNKHHKRDFAFPETAELFGKVCTYFECVDVARTSNVERIVDLNEPQSLGVFDVVLDPGTTEHCFNIGQALMNAANAVTLGGRIVHLAPMSMLNHGFYNLCPTLFQDFYTQNGFAVEHMEMRAHGKDRQEYSMMVDGNTAKRMALPPETVLFVIARRDSLQALRCPTQAKYLKRAVPQVINIPTREAA